MSIATLLDELNDEQRTATTTDKQSVLVLAGAGSGKTKTIVARAAYLIAQGVPAHHIQIMTFTRRAASEIVSRVFAVLGDKAQGLGASTFHAFCIKILHRYRHNFEMSGMTVIDRDDQESLFKLAVSQAHDKLMWSDKDGKLIKHKELLDIYSYARNTQQKLDQSVQKLNSDLLNLTVAIGVPKKDDNKNDLATLDITPTTRPMMDIIKLIMKNYEMMKRENGYIDYDDILEYVAKFMAHSDEFKEILTQEYRHLLIDEMQDTNPLQWLLIKSFVGKSHLFCVGDDAQSIYGFRGADFKNVHSFKDRVPNAQILQLNKNYRSTQEILDVSNWLLCDSPLNYNKQLIAHRGTGIKPALYEFGNEHDEAKFITQDITKRYNDGGKYAQHMILVRTAFSAKAIEMSLNSAQIPYQFIGGRKFMEAAHIKDVLSALRVAVNHKDRLAWVRFLTFFKGIGASGANKMIKGIFVYDDFIKAVNTLNSNTKLPKEPDVVALLTSLHTKQDDCSLCLELAVSALTPTLEQNYFDNFKARSTDFGMLIELAKGHTISSFLETYALDPISTTQINKPEIDDVVSLITVHSAKGAEADICYLPNLNVGQYPHSRANTFDEIEEERRVLYVAMTRAKHELIISKHKNSFFSPEKYDTVNGENVLLPSYFLTNMPNHLLDMKTSITQYGTVYRDSRAFIKPAFNVGLMYDEDFDDLNW